MKQYFFDFGSPPSTYTGLSPTFIIFNANGVTPVAPPGITEIVVGSGIYSFIYGPTTATLFEIDGGVALPTAQRYLTNVLDPIQAVDEKVGFVSDSYGDAVTDPTTIFGYVKRLMEFNEGDAIFIKATGNWSIYSRGLTTVPGFSTLLRIKYLTNDTTSADKLSYP